MNAIRHLPLHSHKWHAITRLTDTKWQDVCVDCGEHRVVDLKGETSGGSENSDRAAAIVIVAVLIDAAAIVTLLGFAIGVIAANL